MRGLYVTLLKLMLRLHLARRRMKASRLYLCSQLPLYTSNTSTPSSNRERPRQYRRSITRILIITSHAIHGAEGFHHDLLTTVLFASADISRAYLVIMQMLSENLLVKFKQTKLAISAVRALTGASNTCSPQPFQTRESARAKVFGLTRCKGGYLSQARFRT